MTSYIILTCDKDYDFLPDCLESINRLKGEKEIIIVNNGTKEIKNSITAGYNLNCVEGRRFGFKNSSGDYVRFIDADDVVLNEIDESKHNEDIIQCSVALKYFEDKEPIIRVAVTKKNILRNYANGLWSRVFKRSFLEKVYGQLPEMKNKFWGEDRILMEYAMMENPEIAFDPTVIYQYNEYRSASTNKNKYGENFYGN